MWWMGLNNESERVDKQEQLKGGLTIILTNSEISEVDSSDSIELFN